MVTSVTDTLAVLAAAEQGNFRVQAPEDRVWLQEGSDLGFRIESILRRGLDRAPAVIALGADTPLVTAGDLMQAVAELASGNAVLGPCHDGGFYLLGVTVCPPGLLADIAWSCGSTCDDAEWRLRSMGLKVTRIRTGFDVDTPNDIARLRRELDRLPAGVAPCTRKWFREISW